MSNLFKRVINYKHIEYITLSFILLFGLFVRLYKINSPIADWHSFRQADTASVSRSFYQGSADIFHPTYHDISRVQSGLDNPNGYRFVEFPIYNYLNAVLATFFPVFNLEVWGRLLSIFSALMSGFLLFLLGKKFISKVGGILASLFYLFIPYNIYFTRVILPEPIGVLFGLLFIIYFVKFIAEPKKIPSMSSQDELVSDMSSSPKENSNRKIGGDVIEREKYVNLAISASFLALALLVKPYFVFYTVPVVFLLLNKYKAKKVITDLRFISFGLIALVPFILWRLWISNYPEGIPFWKWTFNGDGIRFRPAFWYWIMGERLTKMILGFLGLIPFAVGVMALDKSKKFLHHFLLGMFLYVSVVATANVKHDYYQTLTMPAIALILALGTIKLWTLKDFNKTLRQVVVVFSLVSMFIFGFMQVREFYKINHTEIIEAGAALDKIAPKDALVIAAYNGDTAFLYQTKRKGWPVVELPINELIEKGASYYVSVNLNDTQTIEFMNKFEVVEKTGSYVILKLK